MNNSVLLKNLLLNSSQINIIKYDKEKKNRKKSVSRITGLVLLYAMLAFFCGITAFGMVMNGMSVSIPVFCAVTVTFMELLFTIFKVNGYLFAFKDYDMIMALPITVKNVVASKFLYMYVYNLPFVLCICLPAGVFYGIAVKPVFYVYLLWLVLSLLLPLIPMVIATILGTLFAAAGSKSKHKNLVQIILIMAAVFLGLFLRFYIQAIFQNGKTAETLNGINSVTDVIKIYYLPAAWFEKAIVNPSILYALLFIVVNAVVFEVTFTIIARFYRGINSRLMTGAASKKYKMEHLKTKSVVNSIVFKEFKRFTGSPNYFVNCSFGIVLVIVLAVASLFINFDKILFAITQSPNVEKTMLIPAVPMIVFWLTGMLAPSAVNHSLEGKNYWIMQSLPITTKEYLRGKLRFSNIVLIPATVIGNVIISLSCGASVPVMLLCVALGIVQCLFASGYGMFCGLKLPKMEWENEMEVIKQGESSVLYLLPNMFLSMGLVVLAVILGLNIGIIQTLALTMVFYGGLAVLFNGIVLNTKKIKS